MPPKQPFEIGSFWRNFYSSRSQLSVSKTKPAGRKAQNDSDSYSTCGVKNKETTAAVLPTIQKHIKN